MYKSTVVFILFISLLLFRRLSRCYCFCNSTWNWFHIRNKSGHRLLETCIRLKKILAQPLSHFRRYKHSSLLLISMCSPYWLAEESFLLIFFFSKDVPETLSTCPHYLYLQGQVWYLVLVFNWTDKRIFLADNRMVMFLLLLCSE